jgi:hypothetical protein
MALGSFFRLGQRIIALNLHVAVIYYPEKKHRVVGTLAFTVHRIIKKNRGVLKIFCFS